MWEQNLNSFHMQQFFLFTFSSLYTSFLRTQEFLKTNLRLSWFFFKTFLFLETHFKFLKSHLSNLWELINFLRLTWLNLETHLRLSRSTSSAVTSMLDRLISGLWDRRAEDWEESTVVFCTFWYVLKQNWGPIQSRLWGPIWVMISTFKRISQNQGNCWCLIRIGSWWFIITSW